MILYDDEVVTELNDVKALVSEVDDTREMYEEMLQTICDEHQFECIEDAELRNVTFYVSFVEVYKEIVKDLLDYDTSKPKPLQVISNSGESFVHKARWIFAPTALDCLGIVEYAVRRAHFGSTEVNSNSSRSHMIFFINVIATYNDDTVQRSLFKFCDLAGSERTKKTNAEGERLKEAKKINLSLVTLGRCLQMIYNNQAGTGAGQSLIPVRDSRVTLLLQSALLGTEKMSMIVNLMPSVEYFEENLNVLNFSAIAKNILVKRSAYAKPQKRKSSMHLCKPLRRSTSFSKPSFSFSHEEYLDEIDCQRKIILELEEKLHRQEYELRKELVDGFSQHFKTKDEYWEGRIERQKQRLIDQYESKITRLKERHEEDIADLEDELHSKTLKMNKWKAEYGIVDSSSSEDDETDEADESDVVEVISDN